MFLTVIFVAIVSFLFWFVDSRKPKNYPRGPRWYPIFGSALEIMKRRKKTGMLITAIEDLAQEYSNTELVGLKIGKDRVVVLCLPDLIKELLQNEIYDGRPKGPFYETRSFNESLGIILVDGGLWQEHRRFIIRSLKDFGFARRGMYEIIENEAEIFLEDLKNLVSKNNGSTLLQMDEIGFAYILNTLWSLMSGVRYNYDDPQLTKLANLVDHLLKSIDMSGSLFSHFPFLIKIAPEFSGYTKFIEVHAAIYHFISNELKNIKKTLNVSCPPSNLMESYLHEIQAAEPRETYHEKQLMAVCLDLFLAGTETTTKSLQFALFYLIKHQNVQKKCQEEIDRVIGRSRLPKLDDKQNLIYCEAALLEGMRKFMSYVFLIPHRATRNSTLRGYNIPKDTMILLSLRQMMTSKLTWGDDEHLYNPDRFIKDGKISIPEPFYPFGLGKHRCVGEMMGRSNLFLFAVTLLQNFNIKMPDGHILPSELPVDGVTPSVQSYKACITPR